MQKEKYDIIVIGAGSGGLGVSIFMAKIGLKTLLIDKDDENIGGDCLNYGCVPSKALIHVSRILQQAKEAEKFGYIISGKPDTQKAIAYIHSKQEIIRRHENAAYLRKEGLDVVLGLAHFNAPDSIEVNNEIYTAKRIVLATGSRPVSLNVPGIEKAEQYNNESVFDIASLPKIMLIIGGGPIGVEIGQALNRLGSKVTIIDMDAHILPHDDHTVTPILHARLQKEGIEFLMESSVDSFPSATKALIKKKDGSFIEQDFDAIFVAVGRKFELESLQLHSAGIEVKDKKIVVNEKLQTSNKRVFTCGDISGSLMFSHAAEQQMRLLLNNFLSPLKKRLNNDHMSWVTFTDPEIASFGIQEKVLKERKIAYEKLEMDFEDDDRATVDDYRYGKLILYISVKRLLRKQKILGGTMVAPHAGELIQELILANAAGLSINEIFNKIYPYPVASRVNQMILVQYKQKALTRTVQKLLRFMYRLLN